MANATSSQLQQLYIAYFARPGDPTGLDYWLEKRTSTKAFAANMYLQQEFISVNGSLSIQEQINNIYLNLFFRDADEKGLNYWTQQIQTRKLVLASIANDLIYAVNNSTGGTEEEILQRAQDLDCLSNRTAAATAYTAEIRESTAAILAYSPESINPWIPGGLEEGKSYMRDIGCSDAADIYLPCLICWDNNEVAPLSSNLNSSSLEKDSLTGLASQGNLLLNEQENEELINTELNQKSNDECGCNKELEILATDISQYSSLVNSNIDSLEDHSPFGLTSSNNIVMESLVSIDNVLF
tara:strand:+ start:85 stop:975 length:891 start_codon:yes stop_codon:yes gene_type:complete